jgi:hypothetical protein
MSKQRSLQSQKESHKTIGLIKNKLTFRIAVQTSKPLNPISNIKSPSGYHSVIIGLFSLALGLCSFGFCSSNFLETTLKKHPEIRNISEEQDEQVALFNFMTYKSTD